MKFFKLFQCAGENLETSIWTAKNFDWTSLGVIYFSKFKIASQLTNFPLKLTFLRIQKKKHLNFSNFLLFLHLHVCASLRACRFLVKIVNHTYSVKCKVQFITINYLLVFRFTSLALSTTTKRNNKRHRLRVYCISSHVLH